MSRSGEWLRTGAIWGAAGLVVLAVHVGGAIGLMRAAQPTVLAGLAEVFYVDMMPEFSAGPQQAEYDSNEPASPEPPEEPEPQPEPEPETGTAPDFIPPELTRLEPLEDLSPLFERPAVALPTSRRPVPRASREAPRQKEPQTRRAEKPRAQPAAPAPGSRIEAPRSARATAPQGAQGSTASKAAVQSWQSKISAQIARHMKRARLPNQRGRVEVRLALSVDGGGRVTAVSLRGSTGNPRLDSSLDRQGQRLPRLTPPPDGAAKSLMIRIIVE